MITMHCGAKVEGCNARVGEVEDWGLVDPEGEPLESVREIYDQSKAYVERLLINMNAEACDKD